MRALVVCNPAARGGRGLRALPTVLERLRALEVEADVHRTTSLADARAAARGAAATVDAVAAMGGDGVVGACAAGLAQAGPGARAALGVIPTGSGNDAARMLGVPPGDPAAAAALLPTLARRRADLARVDGRHYLNVAGAGLDAEVNRLANDRLAWVPGRARYVGALLAELAVRQPSTFTLTLDGERHEVRAWFVAMANGPSYGGGMRIAPDARIDDGLLDVVVVGAIHRPGFLATFPKVRSGRHVGHPAVSVHRACRVELAADRPLLVYADGERHGELPVVFEACPGAIHVLAAADAGGSAAADAGGSGGPPR
ncbi:MAG TPA: diacylglycerol kinase family protein [Actinomycetota bacterium]|nr:diacylglycerol kinase family protein [Actinomycetota bacterium]